MAASLYVYFFFESIRLPEYLAGSPGIKRLWAPILNFLIHFIADLVMGMIKAPVPVWRFDIFNLLISLVVIVIYKQDDAKESCLLCFKPWIYKRIRLEIIHGQVPIQIPRLPQTPEVPKYPTVSFTYPGYNSEIK